MQRLHASFPESGVTCRSGRPPNGGRYAATRKQAVPEP